MVSYNVYKATSSGAYVEGVCLASDEKPVIGIANGSILFAVDASNGETTRYEYDQESMSWVEAECPCAGGGSGGSGGGEGPLLVKLSGKKHTADKTFGEIQNALASGRGAVVVSVGLAEVSDCWYPIVELMLSTELGTGCGCTYLGRDNRTATFYPSMNEDGADSLNDYPYFKALTN